MTKKIELSPSVAIIICGVIIAAAIVFINRFPGPVTAAPAAQQGGQYANVNVPAPSEADHVYGSRTAKIFLIEYSDFQCPFCSRVNPTLKSLVDESDGEIAWIYRHFPLESIHSEARPSAIASECVTAQLGNDGFWIFMDRVFANQQSMSAALYSSIAGEMGINPIAYNTCVASGTYDALIDQHSGEAAAAGGTGTPFTVVYGGGQQVPVSGAVPLNQWQAVINAVKARL